MNSKNMCEICKISNNIEIVRILEVEKRIICVNCAEKSQISIHLSPELKETNEKRKNYGGSKSSQEIHNKLSFDLFKTHSKISINSENTEITEKTRKSEEEKFSSNKKKKKIFQFPKKFKK